MEFLIASIDDFTEIIEMKNRVKQRIINKNLPMWLNGYPYDELIIEDLNNNYGRIIKLDGKIVAYAAFYPSISDYEGEIDDINDRYSFGRVMVDDGYTGLGIGKFLVTNLINEAKSLTNKGMIITGDDFNTTAINLYTKLGFRKIGEKQFPYAYLSIFKLDF